MTQTQVVNGMDIPVYPNPLDVFDVRKMVILNVKFSRPGTVRKLTQEERQQIVSADGSKVAKDALLMQKRLFESKELDDVRRSDLQFVRRRLARYVLPASSLLREGFYRVPAQRAQEVANECDEYSRERQSLIMRFLGVYQDAIENARLRLGPLFRQEDYLSMTEMQENFGFRWNMFSLSVPESLPATVKQEQVSVLERLGQEVVEECRVALRTSFYALVARAADRLRVKRDGTKVVFRDSMVEGMREFLETFTDKNTLCDDAELAALVEKARAIFAAVPDAERLRTDLQLRSRVQEVMQEVADTMVSQGLIEVGVRDIDLSD